MQADHIIKYNRDHPMMAPKLVGMRLIGGIAPTNGGVPISQENILKAVKNIRNWVGQMPKIIRAKKSVAGFKLRKGADIVVLVTIRNPRIINTLTNTIIYTLMEEWAKASILNNHIRFGLKGLEILNNAGINVDLYLKGIVKENRGNYYKSKLLIP